MAQGNPPDPMMPLLGSLQLLDSFFPSGLYTLSHGLEAYAAAGMTTERTLGTLLADYLRYGVGPADGAALARAHRGQEAGDLNLVMEADIRLTAVKLAREAREASLRTGRQLAALAGQLFDDPVLTEYAALVYRGEAPGNRAIILGLALGSQGAGRMEAVVGELYSFAAGVAGAAIRLGITDHRRAQQVLHGIKPVIIEAAASAAESDARDIGGCLPLVDVMSAQHERAGIRLFMS